MAYEVNEYVYNLLAMMICRGELYRREGKNRLAYLHLKQAYDFSKMLQWSLVCQIYKTLIYLMNLKFKKNADIVHQCILLRMMLIKFNMEFGR